MESHVINSLKALPSAAEALLARAGGRRLIAFYGEVGAGKTTLIQAICRRLGVPGEQTASPTFALINEYEYPLADGGKGLIAHIDLYRLKSLEEALGIGIEDYLFDVHYCLIEWPEIIEPLLPEDTLRIKLEICGDSCRKILIL